jgi:hypothetical protein
VTPSPRVIWWGLGILAAIALAIILANAWNGLWSWLPWSAENRADRAEARADFAEADASARGLEVTGEREQAQRIDTYHRQEVVIRDLTAETITESRSAPDAQTPLDPDRLARLRAGDERLCMAAPSVCPGATPDPVNP